MPTLTSAIYVPASSPTSFAASWSRQALRQAHDDTNVGHLTSGTDEGADKVQLGEKRQGRSAWETAARLDWPATVGQVPAERARNARACEHDARIAENVDERLGAHCETARVAAVVQAGNQLRGGCAAADGGRARAIGVRPPCGDVVAEGRGQRQDSPGTGRAERLADRRGRVQTSPMLSALMRRPRVAEPPTASSAPCSTSASIHARQAPRRRAASAGDTASASSCSTLESAWPVRGPTLTEPCLRGHDRDLRWVLLHLINETARHAGHADGTRELLDGTTGQ